MTDDFRPGPLDQTAVEPLEADHTCKHCGGPLTRDRLIAVPANGRGDGIDDNSDSAEQASVR